MWDMPEHPPVYIGTFHDLRQEITSGIGVHSKEEILAAKELVEKEVGTGVIEKKNAEFLLFDLQPFIDAPPPDGIMRIYVCFEGDKRKPDARYKSRIFFIQDGKIIWVKPA